MPEFEPTIPFGQPELMRASGFTRYLDELGRDAPEGAPSTRLSSLSPSLTQDLMRFEQGGREPESCHWACGPGVAKSIRGKVHGPEKEHGCRPST